MSNGPSIRRVHVSTDQDPNASIPISLFLSLLSPLVAKGPPGPPGSVGETYTAPDADYSVPNDAGLVEIASITASRVITLPQLLLFPQTRDLVIADFSGNLSSDNNIIIKTPTGSGTKIVGTYDDQYMLAVPAAYLRLRRGKNVNAWVVC